MYAQQRLERRPDARGRIKEKGGEKEVRDPDADVPEPARQCGKLSRPPRPKELPCRYQENAREGDPDNQVHLPPDQAQSPGFRTDRSPLTAVAPVLIRRSRQPLRWTGMRQRRIERYRSRPLCW